MHVLVHVLVHACMVIGVLMSVGSVCECCSMCVAACLHDYSCVLSDGVGM